MVGELVAALRRPGLNIDWPLVSLAGLFWDGILQTMLQLEWLQELAGVDAGRLGVLATYDSSQCSSLSMSRSGMPHASSCC